MSKISVTDIQTFRERTGVGMLDAKHALEASGGDFDAAVTSLRKSGQKIADKKASRTTREGVVGVYEHSNKRLVTAVSVACETDFVSRTADFQKFAHELAMHVAAAAPLYLSASEIPADILAKEEDVARSQAAGKPENILTSIIQGKLKKYAEEHCLLEQRFFKDDTKTVGGVVQEAMQKFGENIQVKEFVRLSV